MPGMTFVFRKTDDLYMFPGLIALNVIFWGIGGGINALVTPNVPLTFPDPQYILFFVGHGLLIVCY